MADIAIGRPCPRCGTLTAISGTFSDETLHGVCASCGGMVSAAAFGGERFHAARAAAIPVTSQGLPAPAIPAIVPVPIAPLQGTQGVFPPASPAPAPTPPAPVATYKNRGKDNAVEAA